jgi:hypothetical protein
MTGKKIKLFLVSAILSFSACKDEFRPHVITSAPYYLVVDGFINAGNTPTNFKLSRTINLVDTIAYKTETGAIVTIESDDGFTSLLREDTAGSYSGGPYNFSAGGHYRVRIKTADSKEYLSDAISVYSTPPVDTVSWERNNDGVTIYVNTHGPANNSRYYHWRYTQTWRFHSAFESLLEYKDSQLVLRRNPDSVYTCWHTEESNGLILGSSAALSENIIYKQPLLSIPEDSWQISDKYSILVKQEAVDAETYNYMLMLKKVTEQSGSIFDPQPYSVNGNIHCINDSKQIALGHIYASLVTEKRIFIDNSELPGWIYRPDCDTFTARDPTDLTLIAAGIYVPVYSNRNGLVLTTAFCGNCTVRGTHQKPDFWP